MITMTFQSFSKDETMLVILQKNYINHLTQYYNKKSLILNAEIERNKNKRCMWIRSDNKKSKW